MTDFKIRRGLSTVLFTSPGVVNSRLVIELGCWYLCTDTAELFLGIQDTESGVLTLKQINKGAGSAIDADLAAVIAAIQQDINAIRSVELFQQITSSAELPTDFEAADFDPNITYYINSGGTVSTFIFNRDVQGYICTNGVDNEMIRTLIADMTDEIVEEHLTSSMPEVLKDTLQTVILYGGTAGGV